MTVSPYTLRHSIAMHLFQSGVDISDIACALAWSRESVDGTHVHRGGPVNEVANTCVPAPARRGSDHRTR